MGRCVDGPGKRELSQVAARGNGRNLCASVVRATADVCQWHAVRVVPFVFLDVLQLTRF